MPNIQLDKRVMEPDMAAGLAGLTRLPQLGTRFG